MMRIVDIILNFLNEIRSEIKALSSNIDACNCNAISAKNELYKMSETYQTSHPALVFSERNINLRENYLFIRRYSSLYKLSMKNAHEVLKTRF